MLEELKESLQEDLSTMKRTATQKKKKRCKAPRIRNFLSEETRQQIENNQEMKVYDMRELMKKEDFFKLDTNMQRLYLDEWRKLYTSKDIRSAMGLSCQSYYNLLSRLGVKVRSYTKATPTNTAKNLTSSVDAKPKAEVLPLAPVESSNLEMDSSLIAKLIHSVHELTQYKETVSPLATVNEVPLTYRTVVSWSDSMTGETAAQKFNAMALLLSSDASYEINVEVRQKS